MDVQMTRLFLSLFLFTFFVACAEKKSSQTVFPVDKVSCEDSALRNQYIVQWENGRITRHRGEGREAFIQAFVDPNLAAIKRVEFDRVIRAKQGELLGAASARWTPQPEEPPVDEGIKIVRAPQAWARGYLGKDIIVAVLDSGVDVGHPQIAPNLATNSGEMGVDENGNPKESNQMDDDQNGYVDDVGGWDFVAAQPLVQDYSGHGTHVAGVIAADPEPANGTKAEGFSGVAPKAKILPLAFLGGDGNGLLSDAVMGIEYAVQRGARVINASWGGPSCSSILQESIDALSAQGVLIAVAAGNDGEDIDFNPDFPAAFRSASQVTVGATDFLDVTTAFSNVGYKSVHLMAPGQDIFSSVPGGYMYLSGTSMATPYVAGAAALLWGIRPRATAQQIKTALLRGVDAGPFKNATQGRLNVERAAQELLRLLP